MSKFTFSPFFMKRGARGWIGAGIALIALSPFAGAFAQTEVENLGQIEFGKTYDLTGPKTQQGILTAPKDGKLTLNYGSGMMGGQLYSDPEMTDEMSYAVNLLGRTHTFTVTEGTSYYWSVEAATKYDAYSYKFSMPGYGKEPATIIQHNPAKGKNFDLGVTDGVYIYISTNDFNYDSILLKYTSTAGATVENDITQNSSSPEGLLKIQLSNLISNLIKSENPSEKLDISKEFAITVKNLRDEDGDKIADTDDNGDYSFSYMTAGLPGNLVSSKSPDSFLAWWPLGSPEAIVELEFDQELAVVPMPVVTLTNGNPEFDLGVGYYSVSLPAFVDGNKVRVDLSGAVRSMESALTMKNGQEEGKYICDLSNMTVAFTNLYGKNGSSVKSNVSGGVGVIALSLPYIDNIEDFPQTRVYGNLTPAIGKELEKFDSQTPVAFSLAGIETSANPYVEFSFLDPAAGYQSRIQPSPMAYDEESGKYTYTPVSEVIMRLNQSYIPQVEVYVSEDAKNAGELPLTRVQSIWKGLTPAFELSEAQLTKVNPAEGSMIPLTSTSVVLTFSTWVCLDEEVTGIVAPDGSLIPFSKLIPGRDVATFNKKKCSKTWTLSIPTEYIAFNDQMTIRAGGWDTQLKRLEAPQGIDEQLYWEFNFSIDQSKALLDLPQSNNAYNIKTWVVEDPRGLKLNPEGEKPYVEWGGEVKATLTKAEPFKVSDDGKVTALMLYFSEASYYAGYGYTLQLPEGAFLVGSEEKPNIAATQAIFIKETPHVGSNIDKKQYEEVVKEIELWWGDHNVVSYLSGNIAVASGEDAPQTVIPQQNVIPVLNEENQTIGFKFTMPEDFTTDNAVFIIIPEGYILTTGELGEVECQREEIVYFTGDLPLPRMEITPAEGEVEVLDKVLLLFPDCYYALEHDTIRGTLKYKTDAGEEGERELPVFTYDTDDRGLIQDCGKIEEEGVYELHYPEGAVLLYDEGDNETVVPKFSLNFFIGDRLSIINELQADKEGYYTICNLHGVVIYRSAFKPNPDELKKGLYIINGKTTLLK